jgi:diguanylate cyclase (GGDEF)-like protein
MGNQKLIRNIFIISLAIAVIFPLVNIYFVFPSFTNLLIDNVEDEALRVGNHLSGMLLKKNRELSYKNVSDTLSLNKYQSLLHDFQLMKLKIFNPSGETLYSTAQEDIGKINNNKYFHEIVAAGTPYTKVAKKNTESLEGQIVTVDVVETYVPIMRNNKFYGAFEIYYDLSMRSQKLHDFILLFSIITLILMMAYLMTLIFLIVRSDRKIKSINIDGLPRRFSSPFHLMLGITVSLFIAEAIIMFVISEFPPLFWLSEALFDSTMLVILVSPMLYFFMLRPLLLHISEIGRAKKRISHMSFHDELTNLPNRYLFEDRLRQSLLKAARHRRNVAVMFLDLDHFKRINDIFDHQTGDRVLKELTDRLHSILRSADTITRPGEDDIQHTLARMGGDEFTILLSEIQSQKDSAIVAQRITDVLSQPISINDNDIYVTASIGIAVYPDDGSDAEGLLKNAHSAMHHAKDSGKNTFLFYNNSMNQDTHTRLIMENDLHKAIDNDEFILHFQPRMDMQTSKIVSMEALIRWNKPDTGMVPPLEFIPLAEECGLINTIGEWVLQKACYLRKEWQSLGLPDIVVSVNISGYQFQQLGFVSSVAKILNKTGINPSLLELEITESIMMKGGESTLIILKKLKDMGLKLAMDDFGTGYSSLSYLKRFPLDVLKIDMSFIKDITINKDSAAIVEAIIAMAHSLHLRTVAEGVETEQQLALLRKLGCDEIQGYLLSRPLSEEDFTSFMSKELDKTIFPRMHGKVTPLREKTESGNCSPG